MGVISDAIDSLQEWCENLFKDGIKSQFDSISDLMTETFHKTTEDGGLISTFLTGHPASFSGSASGGTTAPKPGKAPGAGGSSDRFLLQISWSSPL